MLQSRALMYLAGVVLWGAQVRAQEPGLLVSADWVAEHANDPNVAVLQVEFRRSWYDEGHIPGARFLAMTGLVRDGDSGVGIELADPVSVREALEESGVSEGQHLVVYSRDVLAAARAFMTLEAMGLRGRVSLLDGGWGGWRQEGRAVSVREPVVSRGAITLHPRHDVVVDASWVLAHIDDASVSLIDARPDAEYTGADGGMGGMAHPGHIPGAVQLFWGNLVTGERAPRLRSEAELRRLFSGAGAEPGNTVVAYCMVGMRASFTYFAARFLGFDVRLYDGSWHDWGAREDLPYVSGPNPNGGVR